MGMAYQQTLPVDTELIGDFRILGLLGSGGFANTYLALDLTLGREVAIKEFFPSELAVRADTQSVTVKSAAQESQFEWALGRFVREAKTLAKFRHPSVVRVFRVFNANDTAYIVLEFVRGANMETWLKRLERLPTQEEFDEVLPPLLDALEVVHKAGILHRDIKPANIYIREADQTPVLLDFGAAKYAATAAGDAANTTAAIVSKGYSPNEAYVTDSRMQGPWTDIYSLAATAYRSLTGSAPPESTSRILDDDCVPLSEMPELRDQYRPEFLSAIDQALAVIPKDRPQSIAHWRKILFPGLGVAPTSGDPAGSSSTSDAEWHPLSDTPSDAATVYDSGGSLGRSGGSSGGRAFQPVRGSSGPQPAQVQIRGRSVGKDRSVSEPSRGASAGTLQSEVGDSARETTLARVPVDRPSGLANRPLIIGLALMVAGAVGLASQWIGGDQASRGSAGGVTQEASSARLAARQAEDERNRKGEAERLRKEKEDAAERQRLDVERRAAMEEQLKQVKAAAAWKQAEKERQRVAAQAAERTRAEAARAREEEARRVAEAERLERQRQEEERQRVAREAEAERERKEAEARRAEQARLLAELEEERRKQEEERQAKLAQAEEERKRAEEARLKQEEEEAARKKSEVAGTSERAGEFDVAALEPNKVVPAGDARRQYLIKMQTALKDGKCYDGKLNGDIGDASGALEKFETTYTKQKGKPQAINLASATAGEFEGWLNWFGRLEGFVCPKPPAVEKKKSTPKYKKRPSQRSKPSTRKKRTRKKRSKSPKPSGGTSRGDLLRGNR